MALLSTVYLWGIHLSPHESLRQHEPIFLLRALRHASTTLSESHPQKVIHALQAEILLAYYFFRNGRFLEGKYHVSAAASLAISCGLHKIRSINMSPLKPNLIGGTETHNLHPPRDIIEEGERINGFWALFVLDKCWSVALGSASYISDSDILGTTVDTPWPLTMPQYEQVRLQTR